MKVDAPEHMVFRFLASRHHGKQNPIEFPLNEMPIDKVE